MKTIAFIQARMGSRRFPGKIMETISGRPVLQHVITRLRRATALDQIVIVTTVEKRDDEIELFCRNEKIDFFRGSEQDVLSRYYDAATLFKADHIVRITSDCPLIDPEIVDEVISRHKSSAADYTSNTMKRSYPRGFDTEVCSYHSLEKAYHEASDQPCREHVTMYFYRHPELFRLESVEAKPEFCRPDIRICVDTPEDLALVRAVFDGLKHRPSFTARDIVRLFDERPELLKINTHVQQKSI